VRGRGAGEVEALGDLVRGRGAGEVAVATDPLLDGVDPPDWRAPTSLCGDALPLLDGSLLDILCVPDPSEMCDKPHSDCTKYLGMKRRQALRHQIGKRFM
jgi:hypothetical protein